MLYRRCCEVGVDIDGEVETCCFVFRVLNAGQANATLIRIVNPYKQWRDRRVGVCFAL